jgi:hypothetical protein
MLQAPPGKKREQRNDELEGAAMDQSLQRESAADHHESSRSAFQDPLHPAVVAVAVVHHQEEDNIDQLTEKAFELNTTP